MIREVFISGSIILASTIALAAGPKYRHTPAILNDEVENIYNDIKKASNATLDPLSVSSATISSATISAATISSATISTATISNLIGTTTNNSACTGCVGEYVSSAVSDVGLTQNQFANITSISLSAGDWDVTGLCRFNYSTNQSDTLVLAVSIYSGNTTTDHVSGSNALSALPSTSTSNNSITIAAYRISVSATTTVYLKGFITNTATTATGRISARRVR